MRYSYKVVFIILIIISLGILQQQSRSINYSLKIAPADECSEEIIKWVNGHDQSQREIYITKIEKSRESEKYYIYVSGSIIESFNAGSDKENINMEISTQKAQFNDRVISISTHKKEPKNLIINGNKYNVSQIPLLEATIDNNASNNNQSLETDSSLQKSLESLTTYRNQRYGFSFDIPKKWDKKYEVVEDGDRTSFYYTGCPGKKIEFFTIVAWDKEEFNKLNEEDLHYTNVHILGQKANFVFEEILPVDIDFNEKETEKYGEEYILLAIPVEEIHKRFYIEKQVEK